MGVPFEAGTIGVNASDIAEDNNNENDQSW
jgi:hypothetical protein